MDCRHNPGCFGVGHLCTLEASPVFSGGRHRGALATHSCCPVQAASSSPGQSREEADFGHERRLRRRGRFHLSRFASNPTRVGLSNLSNLTTYETLQWSFRPQQSRVRAQDAPSGVICQDANLPHGADSSPTSTSRRTLNLAEFIRWDTHRCRRCRYFKLWRHHIERRAKKLFDFGGRHWLGEQKALAVSATNFP